MEQLNNTLYLKQIAIVGDKQKIIADNDIYSVTGIKLIGQGSQINTQMYSKILSHKLAKPIDESLTIENCMTTDVILAKLNELQEDNILAKEIFEKINNKELVTRIIKSITIPKPLQFKLSILNINMEKTVHHCLLVALTSIYIAHKLNLETDKIVKLACAAIFLDIGLLHLDQEIFNKNSSLSNEERNQIYSHPIIATLIMYSYIHDKSVSLAILDHHERADGSGYPKGKLLDDISKHGQILGIAELAVSISESSGKYNFKARIQAILKFNSEQYIKEALPI